MFTYWREWLSVRERCAWGCRTTSSLNVSRSNHVRSNQCSNSASYVDDARAGKVNVTLFVQPCVIGPGPVHDDWVDEACDDDRVNKVSDEVGPSSHGTADDGGASGSKRPLVKPAVAMYKNG